MSVRKLSFIFIILLGYVSKVFSYKKSVIKNILLIRMDLLGDCSMFSRVASDLITLYPEAEITILCLPSSKEIFKRLGFKEIITFPKAISRITAFELFTFLFALRSKKYDLLLQPQCSRTPIVDVIAAGAKSCRKVAIKSKPGNAPLKWIKFSQKIYNELIDFPKGWVSEFAYYGAFVKGLGFSNYKTRSPHIPYDQQWLVRSKYFVIYPGASFCQRMYPQEKFAEIITYVFKKTGLTPVILGIREEDWIAKKILDNLSIEIKCSVINLVGKTTVENVIDLVGNAQFIIANDTSGAHIAAGTRTDCVVIVGGGHFDRFFPYHLDTINSDDKLPIVVSKYEACYFCDWNWEVIGQRNEKCLDDMKHSRCLKCIRDIPVVSVIKEVEKILKDLRYE